MSPWSDAVLAAALIGVDPVGLGGVVLRARAGPVRALWLDLVRKLLPAGPLRTLPPHCSEERLIGGVDLAATLSLGAVRMQPGLLADVSGGVVLAPMAERMDDRVARLVAAAMDLGEVVVEREGMAGRIPTRFGVIAIDEGLDEHERAPSALRDRLALGGFLDTVSIREARVDTEALLASVEAARARPEPEAGHAVEPLVAAAWTFGVFSLRAPMLALNAARAHARLRGAERLEDEDLEAAARLVLGPRATRLPPPPDEDPEPPSPPPPSESPPAEAEGEDRPPAENELEELLIQAVAASLPDGVLARLQAAGGGSAGTAGEEHWATTGGRPVGARRGSPGRGARLDVVETLRAAAPWQRVRGRHSMHAPLRVQADDFRVSRRKRKSETTTIFVVDASGSSALQRMAEAKGAVEQVLADCYVRRDNVALIAFRGEGAELLLPPTRSLVRAKRSLAGLPGGGATPLASGVWAGFDLAEDARRRGQSAVVVMMTDGRGNVTRDGRRDRDDARSEALTAAAMVRSAGVRVLFVDTSPRPRPEARELSDAMAAEYLWLPRADSGAISRSVQGMAGASS